MSKMKMSDVFKLPMVQGSIVLMSNDHRYVIEFDNSYSDVGDQIEHTAHAINNHDRMVEEIAELKRLVNSYKLASDEITKYKYALSYNDSYFGEPEGEIKNNMAELDMISCKAIKLLAKLNQEVEE